MNIRHLKVFAAVYETGSVTRAAAKLFTTQPAVSHAIRELEEEIGLVLFDRLSRRLHPTEGGRLFHDKAARLLEQFEELERGAAALEGEAPLRIGSCITIAGYWLPEMLLSFTQKKDAAAPNVRVASAVAVMDMLSRGEIDVALYEGPAPAAPHVSYPFSSYQVVPVCSPEHPFAERRAVAVESLLAERLLLREPGSAVRDVFDNYLRLRQLEAVPVLTSVNSQVILRMAMKNLGIGILPDIVAREYLDANTIATFQVKGMSLKNVNRIVLHRDKHRSEDLRRFIETTLKTGKQHFCKKSGCQKHTT